MYTVYIVDILEVLLFFLVYNIVFILQIVTVCPICQKNVSGDIFVREFFTIQFIQQSIKKKDVHDSTTRIQTLGNNEK
jgi:hypothetical protein